jgi:hypothetical protein
MKNKHMNLGIFYSFFRNFWQLKTSKIICSIFILFKKIVIYRQKNKKAGAVTHQVMMIHETLAAAHSHRYLHACMQLGCGRASCHCISSISINNG